MTRLMPVRLRCWSAGWPTSPPTTPSPGSGSPLPFSLSSFWSSTMSQCLSDAVKLNFSTCSFAGFLDPEIANWQEWRCLGFDGGWPCLQFWPTTACPPKIQVVFYSFSLWAQLYRRPIFPTTFGANFLQKILQICCKRLAFLWQILTFHILLF